MRLKSGAHYIERHGLGSQHEQAVLRRVLLNGRVRFWYKADIDFDAIGGKADVTRTSRDVCLWPKADMNAETVTLFRGPERPRFSRHETREQADEPR